MVLCASGRQGMPHLFSGLIALGVAAAVLLGGGIVAVHLEHATIVSTAPGWFLRTRWDGYEGGFSLMAASEVTFGTALDFKLKRDIASRMLKYPATLQDSPFLEFALKRLASGRLLDRVVFCALWPLGKVQTAILKLQDHFAAFNYIRHKIKPAPPSHLELLDWPNLISTVSGPESADEERPTKAASLNEEKIPGPSDAKFQS